MGSEGRNGPGGDDELGAWEGRGVSERGVRGGIKGENPFGKREEETWLNCQCQMR